MTSSGEDRPIEPTQLKEWVTVAGNRASEVTYVELGYPSDLLRNNVVLVDTPGVNDLNEQRAEVTYGYVPRADAVVFLLDAGQALKDSEREFLRSRVLESARDRLIFVLGKMDMLSADERTAVLDYVRGGLAKMMPDPVVFPLSAKDWAKTKDRASGMPELMQYLERFLARDRAQVILDNAATDAARTRRVPREQPRRQDARLRPRPRPARGADQGRARAARHQQAQARRAARPDRRRRRLDQEQVALDLEQFAKAFVAALPAQIDANDANDIKAFLPAFIEDKFKEWAELEGDKLGSMLEHLAEEVISITNENVAAAAATLAERLGPNDTQIDITVDSFKYDVGSTPSARSAPP